MPRLGDASHTQDVPRVGLGCLFVFWGHLVPVSSQGCVTLEGKVLVAGGVMGDALSAPRGSSWASHPPKGRVSSSQRGLRGRQQSACTSALSLCLLVRAGALLTTHLGRVKRAGETQAGKVLSSPITSGIRLELSSHLHGG